MPLWCSPLENVMMYKVSSQGKPFEDTFSKDILVGNLVLINKNQYFPCDMLIISTSDDAGRCYIETKNLDGETNKKIKFSHKDMFEKCKTE